MTISFDSLPKRVRQWYISHIYRMYHFRTIYQQGQKTTDSQERKKVSCKVAHLQKKVEQHMVYGESLGISEDKIRTFNLAIIEEVKKRKNPQVIIQTLIKKNGQK